MLTKPGPVVPARHGRGMRDSDSRGLTPNTLSKFCGRSFMLGQQACDLVTLCLRLPAVAGERHRTSVNETKTETGRVPWHRGTRAVHVELTVSRAYVTPCRVALLPGLSAAAPAM
jgi:hypothetical protein